MRGRNRRTWPPETHVGPAVFPSLRSWRPSWRADKQTGADRAAATTEINIRRVLPAKPTAGVWSVSQTSPAATKTVHSKRHGLTTRPTSILRIAVLKLTPAPRRAVVESRTYSLRLHERRPTSGIDSSATHNRLPWRAHTSASPSPATSHRCLLFHRAPRRTATSRWRDSSPGRSPPEAGSGACHHDPAPALKINARPVCD